MLAPGRGPWYAYCMATKKDPAALEAAHEAHRDLLRRMAEARVAFWRRAQVEGWAPSRPASLEKKTMPAPGPDDLPLAYRIEGASPGVWPDDARRTPEWVRWKRARDRVFADHGGLVVAVVQPRTLRHRGADLEEVWAEARIALLRGIDLYDVERTHPRTGKPLAPATYLYRWVWMGCCRGLKGFLAGLAEELRDEITLPTPERDEGDIEAAIADALDRAYSEGLDDPSDLGYP